MIGEATRRAALAVLLVPVLPVAPSAALSAADDPRPATGVDAVQEAPASVRAASDVAPADLLAQVPGRVPLLRERSDVPAYARPDADAAWRDELAGWVAEAFAPLRAGVEACDEVFAASGARVRGDSAARLAERAVQPGRPIAEAPAGERIVVPESLPDLGQADVEMLRASGMLPLEIALSGEWARAVAARLAGPPPRDPLLRMTRAARLEGVARLAGVAVTVSGSGIEPDELGSSLLALDMDRAGLPRDALLEAVADGGGPLERAAARVMLEDGPRWALFHWLRGGRDALEAALGRPAVTPEELLRPGRSIGPPAGRPPGCRLGPRLAAALVIGEDDPPWLGDLVGDSFVRRGERSILGWLAFEDDAGARRAAQDLTARGLRAEAVGRVIALYRDFD